jgi:hypothetical protein
MIAHSSVFIWILLCEFDETIAERLMHLKGKQLGCGPVAAHGKCIID